MQSQRSEKIVNLQKTISIPDYYAGQSVFITGGTGLIGKALIEKILRSCPDVAKIYVLIRPKKGMSIQERWAKITKLPLFDKLNMERPEAFEKINLIPGDLREPDLLITEEVRKILTEKVTLVYHGAAMVQFTDSIRDALLYNSKGTQHLLELTKLMTKLKAFVYISTAYVNADKPPAEGKEEIQPACQDWTVMMEILKKYPLQLESLKEKLLCGHPNPYTWSKSLTEQAVHSYSHHFPTIIMRPGIVGVAMKDPFPGWADSWSGHSLIGMAILTGQLHVVPTSPHHYLDYVPLDYVVRGLLLSPWRLHIKKKTEVGKNENVTDVYNCCIANNKPISDKELERGGLKHLRKYPCKYSVWVSSVTHVTNRNLFNILFFIYQVIPAALVDLLLNIHGNKTKALKLTISMTNLLRLTGNLSDNNIAYPNEKCSDLWQSVKDEDKDDFYCSLNIGRNDEIADNIFLGLRKYCLNEDMSEEALKKNKIRMDRIKLFRKTSKTLLYLMMSYWLFSKCGLLMEF